MNLVLFDFDKTIVNRDTGAAYMKFMLCRNPTRLFTCFLFLPLSIPFLIHAKSKYIGFSILLWFATFSMSLRNLTLLRRAFIQKYLSDNSTRIFNDAIEHLQWYASNSDKVVVLSGASEWMVKAIFSHKDLPSVEFFCSKEKWFFGGIVSKFHCYAYNKVKCIRKRYKLAEQLEHEGKS